VASSRSFTVMEWSAALKITSFIAAFCMLFQSLITYTSYMHPTAESLNWYHSLYCFVFLYFIPSRLEDQGIGLAVSAAWSSGVNLKFWHSPARKSFRPLLLGCIARSS